MMRTRQDKWALYMTWEVAVIANYGRSESSKEVNESKTATVGTFRLRSTYLKQQIEAGLKNQPNLAFERKVSGVKGTVSLSVWRPR